MPVMRVRERPVHRPASMRLLTPVAVEGPELGRTAAALDPPTAWLTDEAADAAPPRLTVYDGGRIAGVVAPEGVCILNEQRPGECWVVPRPRDGRGSTLDVPLDGGWEQDYRMAHVGQMKLAEGPVVACATLAGAGGHASPWASNLEAVRHYQAEPNVMDDTRYQVARGRYVWSDRAGGVVFLGATWPEVTDRQVAEIRAAACSIDYRWVTGRGVDDYRLLGATLVNIGALPTKYEHRIRAAGIMTITDEEIGDAVGSSRQPAIVAAALGVVPNMSSFTRAAVAPCHDCGGSRTAAYVIEENAGPEYGAEVVWGNGEYGMLDTTTTMADGSAAFLVRPIINQLASDDTVVVPEAGATVTGRVYTWDCNDEMIESENAVLSPPPPEAGGTPASTAPAAPSPVTAASRLVRLAAAPPGAPATPPASTDTAPSPDTSALDARVTKIEDTLATLTKTVEDMHQQMLSSAKSTASEPVAV